jgi:SAM-dependent methyltransferase
VIEEWRRAFEQSRMVGWDFSVLNGRLSADDPWWDFEGDCRSAIGPARRIADLGTGGGERLLGLLRDADVTGKSIIATEGWEPNEAVGRQALAAHGIEVVGYDSERDARMPFADGSYDLVMSRHESIDAREIARVLARGGRLLTQQVDGRDAEELHEWFDAPFEYPHVTSGRFVEDLERAGLQVDLVDDWSGTMEFADVTALVTYLALIPWDVPDFSVSGHEARLRILDADRPITVTQRRFRLYATKP